MPPETEIHEIIWMPPQSGDPSPFVALRCAPNLVIIGANGSGKTRLGTWLEVTGPDKDRAYRIPAQRSLRFPNSASPIGMQAAKDGFQFGERPANWTEEIWTTNKSAMRLNMRYGNVDINEVASAPVDDFQKLMVLLFSENYTNLINFDEENQATEAKVRSPNSKLKIVKRIWESILSHRTIAYKSGEVRVRPLGPTSESYLAKGMSDGERVIFYLIAQCLCAPESAVIIIDEPELHLHRSIQRVLWDAIEDERSDCQFVYITHDLSFAEERNSATKVWLKSSTQDSFQWTELTPLGGIPEALYLEVLGSRKPVIFSEGTFDSIDYDVYSAVYAGFTVRPTNGCTAVAQATKAFRQVVNMHHLTCYGLVDRDYLTEGQLASHVRAGIGSPTVAEIENLFLVPEVLEVMVEILGVDNEVLDRTYKHIFSEFARAIPTHALALTKRDVSLALGRFGNVDLTVQELESNFATLIAGIDIKKIYAKYIAESNEILVAQNYREILKVFNKKDLLDRVTGFFGLTKPTYLDRARKLTRKRDERIVQALALYLPNLSNLS
jgi:hypothetical protein